MASDEPWWSAPNMSQWTQPPLDFFFFHVTTNTCFLCCLNVGCNTSPQTKMFWERLTLQTCTSTHRPSIFFLPPTSKHIRQSQYCTSPLGGTSRSLFFSSLRHLWRFCSFLLPRLSFLSCMCFIAAIDAAWARARPCTGSQGSCEPVRPRRRGRLTNSPHRAQTSLFPALPTCRASRCVVPLISQKNRRDDVWMERGSSSSILGGWKRALCIFQRTSPPGQSLS